MFGAGVGVAPGAGSITGAMAFDAATVIALLDPAGAELCSLPAAWYAPLGRPVTFASVVAIAARRGEVALGWRKPANATDDSRHFGQSTNPAKSCAATFTADDRVIVLADPAGASTGPSSNGQARTPAST